MKHQHPGSQGFTLIEVLAALLLIGIVLPVAMQGVSIATRTATLARQKSEAASMAQSKLNELLASGNVESGPQAGDFAEDGAPEFSWKATIDPWSDPNALVANSSTATINQISVTVIWRFGTQDRSVMVSTLVYPNSNNPSVFSGSK